MVNWIVTYVCGSFLPIILWFYWSIKLWFCLSSVFYINDVIIYLSRRMRSIKPNNALDLILSQHVDNKPSLSTAWTNSQKVGSAAVRPLTGSGAPPCLLYTSAPCLATPSPRYRDTIPSPWDFWVNCVFTTVLYRCRNGIKLMTWNALLSSFTDVSNLSRYALYARKIFSGFCG